jgi:hypothetical protein
LEDFKRKLRRRITYGIAYCLLVLVIVVTAMKMRIEDHATSFALGFGCGMLIVALAYTIKYLGALKNEAKLRALYIEETDERSRHINERVGATGINVAIAVFSLAMLISNYVDPTVFMTMLAVTLFTVLLKSLLGIYFARRI